ncbi:diadenylate cyclase CdaA [Leptothoe sp. PORK10 BA2]|uniref:diadenylate cyclase CdaA n=1 Tax=Leptothoe sp. PORK10 BA2 TaxID=3110254 RepID=UPI002B211720|nr:diadenylate cyclase CdaA [Leptothoe sp. PORK10 BA2]MEA5463247.1 diadenylate cyclase CdaA [Leptothoe sp. PORK10 BA2]
MLGLFVQIIDITLVLVLIYLMLLVIGERRNLWMIRGLIVLMLAAVLSHALKLPLLGFVLTNLSFGAAVAMAFMLQVEIRRFLELLGRGEIGQLFSSSNISISRPDSVIDELVDAVRELSQKRTGALMILEVGPPIDENDFSVPGVRLDAELSKELIQTIFQTTTLLHDGAILIRASRIVAAGVILPISERMASRQLGTRHRAAMGITERIENCLCIVVSEETGSISIAQRGSLNRPLTSNRLRELLQEQFTPVVDSDTVTPKLLHLGRRVTGLWKWTRQLGKR